MNISNKKKTSQKINNITQEKSKDKRRKKKMKSLTEIIMRLHEKGFLFLIKITEHPIKKKLPYLYSSVEKRN